MHPIFNYDFDILLSEFRKRKRFIYEKRDNDLSLFNYNDNAMYKNKWDEFICMCRGLIVDTKEKRFIAIPFYKFFNAKEKNIDLNEMIGDAHITEKLDGSLGIIYHYNDKWNVSTRGSFKSPQSLYAQEYLDNNISKYNLIEGNTYLVEIIYKQNKIVCNYDYEGLILLSGNSDTGIELSYDDLLKTNMNTVNVLKFPSTTTYKELYDYVDTFTSDREGIVIRTHNDRFKIKGRRYLLQHKSISKITPLYIWECLKINEDIKYDEEHKDDVDKIKSILLSQYEDEKNMILNIKGKIQDISDDRDAFISCENNRIMMKNISRRYLSDNDFIDDTVRNGIFNIIRPRGNKLKGYNCKM